jgi:DNA-binding MarR family transcriptional regulator
MQPKDVVRITHLEETGDVDAFGNGLLDGEAAREILRGCVCSRTRMLNRVLSRLFDDSLAPLGVRSNQLTVLALLGAMEGLLAADVARYLEMDKSTVSRGLALLRGRGWIEESAAGPTRASRSLSVTTEGRKLLRDTLPLWRSAVEGACEALGEESVEALRGAADSFLRLRASLQKASDQGDDRRSPREPSRTPGGRTR